MNKLDEWFKKVGEHKASPYEYLGDVGKGLYDFRNQLLTSVCVGKNVLEIGCGCGRTAYEVSKVANSVIAIDEDKDALEYAKKTYSRKNLKYMLTKFENFSKMKFDVIVMIEVFEHIHDQKAVLKNINKMLKNNGILFLTTPNDVKQKFKSPYHTHEFKKDELEDLLGKWFDIMMLWGIDLRRTIRFYNYKEKRREFKTMCGDVVISTELPERMGYFLAVCKKKKIFNK
jgi:2-polyprenyl-3-methyl-5-hydroxy-6-metoxy-1,4-benzoquinol methylase